MGDFLGNPDQPAGDSCRRANAGTLFTRLQFHTYSGAKLGEMRWQQSHNGIKKTSTPRVDANFGSGTAVELQGLLENIVDICFRTLNCTVSTATGCYSAASTLPSLHKLEAVSELIVHKRARHLRRHPNLKTNRVFNDDAMTESWHACMNDRTSWRKELKLHEY